MANRSRSPIVAGWAIGGSSAQGCTMLAGGLTGGDATVEQQAASVRQQAIVSGLRKFLLPDDLDFLFRRAQAVQLGFQGLVLGRAAILGGVACLGLLVSRFQSVALGLVIA